MRSQNLLVSTLMTCVLAASANTALAGKSKLKARDSARSYELEMRGPRRGPRIHLPIGPSYVYYDYPYYYSRGHYPTHIGGYVYYPYSYYSRGSYRDPRSPRRHWAR